MFKKVRSHHPLLHACIFKLSFPSNSVHHFGIAAELPNWGNEYDIKGVNAHILMVAVHISNNRLICIEQQCQIAELLN